MRRTLCFLGFVVLDLVAILFAIRLDAILIALL